MTITETNPHTAPGSSALLPVAFDLYRDIHKAIRSELFTITATAGAIDPADAVSRGDLARHVTSVVDFLDQHAEHEDAAIESLIETHLPEAAETIAGDHSDFERAAARLGAMAVEAVDAAADHRWLVHCLYVDLAAFTSRYLAHQDLEERVVMPGLEAAIGVDAVIGVHQQLVGGMPPEELMRGLALMLPAMNVDDRSELLGGMRAEAPAEVFDAVWSLAGSVLAPADVRVVAGRLDLDGAASPAG